MILRLDQARSHAAAHPIQQNNERSLLIAHLERDIVRTIIRHVRLPASRTVSGQIWCPTFERWSAPMPCHKGTLIANGPRANLILSSPVLFPVERMRLTLPHGKTPE